MKKLSSLLFLAIFLILTSCSSEDNLETDSEILNARTLRGPIINTCTGYGLFVSTHGQQYDCGWKRGYDDWVAHYNWVASNYDYPQCAKIRVIIGSGTVGILWSDTSISQTIIQQTQNTYQNYYNNLAANQQSSDFAQGQFAGYAAGRGQQPYVANNEDTCP